MTIINTNSISGINSITAQGASGIEFYDSSGNSVHTVTGDGLTVGTGATISGSTNTIDFRTGNSSVVRIDSSTRLSVGGAGSIDSQFQVVNSSQDTAESVARFESAAAGSGFSQSLVHVYKGNGYGGAIGGYIDQGVGHGLSLNTVNDGTLSERLRITSAGNVGINTTAPTDILDINTLPKQDGAISPRAKVRINQFGHILQQNLTVVNNNAGISSYWAFAPRDSGVLDISYSELDANDNTSYDLLTINPTGNVEIRNGNLVLSTNGSGIDFHNFGSGATVDSNLLDDYEEGTWTPEARDNFSSGNQGSFDLSVGYYTKIGNQVTVWGRFSNVDTSGMTAGFDFCVAGLPFAASSNLTFATGTIHTNFFTFSGQINPRIEGARSSFRIQECASGSNNDFVTVSQVSSGTADAFFVLTYFV